MTAVQNYARAANGFERAITHLDTAIAKAPQALVEATLGEHFPGYGTSDAGIQLGREMMTSTRQAFSALDSALHSRVLTAPLGGRQAVTSALATASSQIGLVPTSADAVLDQTVALANLRHTVAGVLEFEAPSAGIANLLTH